MLDVATYNGILFPNLVNLCSVCHPTSSFHFLLGQKGGTVKHKQTAGLSANNVSILCDLESIQYGHRK